MKYINCAGGLFLSMKTKRFLLLMRNHEKTAGTWGLVGGKQEPCDKTDYDTLNREIQEELGFLPEIIKTIPFEVYESEDQAFYYNTYVILVENEFCPDLNEEHSGYCWVSFENWPKPLHNGLKYTLNSKINKAKFKTILDMI